MLFFGGVGDRVAVGTPGELLDAFGCGRHGPRVAAIERHDPDLGVRIVARADVCEEGQLRAVGREARIAEPFAVIGQRPAGVRRDIDEVEIAGVRIGVPRDPGDDDGRA